MRTFRQSERRVRLENARELLRRTDLSLADIAARTGFEYMSYLSRAFKRAFGENPSDFRARNRR
jgi:LacI family transcriptional regulator